MTPLWSAQALVAATGGAMPMPFAAQGVSIDTRTLRPGDLFVALTGTTDGHAHVATAIERGAAGVMVSDIAAVPPGAPALIVDDTLAGLTALGSAGRKRFQGRVIAVTGSVGKTTTKDMLRTMLAAFGPTHAAEASYNNQWGVPLTLARLPAEAAFCVAEIGMNNPGEILPLAALVAPHVAAVTTVGSAHIGHMGSIEAIAEEKASLFDRLVPGGTAIVPGTSPHAATLRARAPGPVLAFGGDGAVRPIATEPDAEGTTIEAEVAGRRVHFRLSAPGEHMVANALAALAVAVSLGLDPTRAATALEAFKPGAGRGQQRHICGGTVLLLDESYNASTASIQAALDVLHLLPAARRIAVLGDMLELGTFAESEHASLAPAVAQAADLLYACGPLTRALFDRVPQALRAHHADDAETLAPIVAAAVRPGDAVLVKGSLGSRMRVVVRALEDAGTKPSGGPIPRSGGPV